MRSVVGTAFALDLHLSASHPAAFHADETILHPYAERVQQELTPRLVRLLHVETRGGIAVARMVQRLLGSKWMQALLKPGAASQVRQGQEDFTLPEC